VPSVASPLWRLFAHARVFLPLVVMYIRCPYEWLRRDEAKMHAPADPIWARIHDHQGDEPWGSMLDAGTGSGSLRFITRLNTTKWSAVTASSDMHTKLATSFKDKIRYQMRRRLCTFLCVCVCVCVCVCGVCVP
jgi:hypothetical protein